MDARRFLLLAGCLAVVFTALCLPAMAQTGAGLKGTVVDKDGAPLPSARITIKNDSLGVNQGAVTDGKGEFRIVPLAPGKGYILEVAFPEMGTIKMDVEVAAGKIFTTTITLRPSSEMKETVKVTARGEVVNTETTTTATTFTSEFIDSLPILGRDYQDVLTLAPGVTDVDGDGNPTIHGSRDVDVVTLVDGVSTNDPLTGKRGQELNLNSIQEIEVKTAGASAEYGRAQGGFVNIVTKSGGNEFEGAFSFELRSNILDGDGAGIDDPRLHGGLGELGLRDLKFNDFYPAITLGGPIVKDKAWYFFTAEYRQIEVPVNALTQAFVLGANQKRIFGKMTWQLSTNHKLQFTTTLDPQEYNNLGLDSFTAVESGYTAKLGGLNLVLKETSIFNPNVFLETTVQHFSGNPSTIPTLDADTNHNGVLFVDRNHNHFIDASERDAGEDLDRDMPVPLFDVFEDTVSRNGVLDPGEDRDGDGRLTRPRAGCEGYTREDVDCDGHVDRFWEDIDNDGSLDLGEDKDGDRVLDYIDEDWNHNGNMDPGEDSNENGHLDTRDEAFAKRFPNIIPYIEDRNRNQILDDRVRVFADDQIFFGTPDDPDRHQIEATYPYGRFSPIPRDRDYEIDQATLRATGPNAGTIPGVRGFTDYTSNSGRITLREDLTVFVSDWHGQHDMKFGTVGERETYSQDTELRPILFPHARPVAGAAINPAIGVQLPAENHVFNEATNTTFGMYAQDTYKPLPNLTVFMGVRFDREATDSFGYTPFDPVRERGLYDRLVALGGAEGKPDNMLGNNDNIESTGYCSDPIFSGGPGPVCEQPLRVDGTDPNHDRIAQVEQDLLRLKFIAPSRLTQHHTSTTVVAASLQSLFPDAVSVDPITQDQVIDRQKLRELGAATFQEREAFRLTNNNLAPRLSISWDPWADSKTKVFLNWGRFFDRLFLQTVVPEEGPDTIFRYYEADANGVSATGVPNNGIGAPIAKAPPSASQVDRGLQTPFSDEMTIGFERELAPELSVRFTYINKRYRDQLQDRDINHATRCCMPDGSLLDTLGNLLPPASGNAGAPSQRVKDGKPDLYINNFFFNQIFRVGNINRSYYNGVEIQLTKRLSRKWQMDASYTYSRNRAQAESFDSALGDDPATVGQEFSYAEDDLRHVVKFNASTYLPKDWQVGTTINWSSGLPYSVVSNFLSLNNFDYPQFRLLYGYTPEEPDVRGDRPFHILRRNDHRNSQVMTIDLLARKSFVLGKLNAKFSFTVENVLNVDYLRINTYEPASPNRSGNLQLDSERDFGRRFQAGLEFQF